MKTKVLLIITIFLCCWRVYSANTEKAPLVLQCTYDDSTKYFYLQSPKKIGDDRVKYDHDIWYKNQAGDTAIMFSKLAKNGETKKWVVVELSKMKEEYPSVFGRYDHPDNQLPPAFPTEKSQLETWKFGNDHKENHYKVKSFIPAISNITSEELKKHVDFITKNTKAGVTEYVKTKLDENIDQSFIPTISNIESLNSNAKNTEPEITEYVKTQLDEKSDLPINPEISETKPSEEVNQHRDKIRKTFDTRAFLIKGITVVFITIVIYIVVCILCPDQVEETDDMTDDETSDTYDEENPAPIPRISTSDSEIVCPITPVILRTSSNSASSLNLVFSEEKIDHPTPDTDSLQLEEKVSNDIVTQQETDTKALLSSEDVFVTDTEEKTNSLHSEEKVSNDIATQQETDTDTNENIKSLKSAVQISVEATILRNLP